MLLYNAHATSTWEKQFHLLIDDIRLTSALFLHFETFTFS